MNDHRFLLFPIHVGPTGDDAVGHFRLAIADLAREAITMYDSLDYSMSDSDVDFRPELQQIADYLNSHVLQRPRDWYLPRVVGNGVFQGTTVSV